MGISNIRKALYAGMLQVLELEKYIPYMSAEELRLYEREIAGEGKANFSPEKIANWEKQLQARTESLKARFEAANAKSGELCKHQKAKK